MIKPLPATHFWKCYCAAHSLGEGYVQKLHLSNKDALFEQRHFKQPDTTLLLMGSPFFSPVFLLWHCQNVDLMWVEWRSLSCISQALKRSLTEKKTTCRGEELSEAELTHGTRVCLQNKFSGPAVTGTVPAGTGISASATGRFPGDLSLVTRWLFLSTCYLPG